jgi:hypothetical protein
MPVTQLYILASAAIAITLIVLCPKASVGFRAGNWIGLLGQPVWLYETLKADQFGMFVVSLWFTGVYLVGALRRPQPYDSRRHHGNEDTTRAV